MLGMDCANCGVTVSPTPPTPPTAGGDAAAIISAAQATRNSEDVFMAGAPLLVLMCSRPGPQKSTKNVQKSCTTGHDQAAAAQARPIREDAAGGADPPGN